MLFHAKGGEAHQRRLPRHHPSSTSGNVDFERVRINLVLSMTQPFAGVTASQLRAAVALKEKIEALEKELASVLGAAPPSPAPVPEPARKGQISAAGRARIAAAQKARWAKVKQAAAPKPAAKPKRKLSPEGRRRIIEATKARWAKIRAAKAGGGGGEVQDNEWGGWCQEAGDVAPDQGCVTGDVVGAWRRELRTGCSGHAAPMTCSEWTPTT